MEKQCVVACIRRSIVTTSDDIADNAVDSRIITRPRRGRQARPGAVAGSTKRFPQFPPGATAAAAKAARAGDVADHQRSVSLPVLSSSRAAAITTSVSNLVPTTPSCDPQSSPRDSGELLVIVQ